LVALGAAWIDEPIGHDSIIRQSEGARYTKGVYLSILKRTIDKVRLPLDLSHLKYSGQRGGACPRRRRRNSAIRRTGSTGNEQEDQ
jgi:hypothetical protein